MAGECLLRAANGTPGTACDEERCAFWESIGMTHGDLVDNLGTIAHSGTKAFLKQLAENQRPDARLIGTCERARSKRARTRRSNLVDWATATATGTAAGW